MLSEPVEAPAPKLILWEGFEREPAADKKEAAAKACEVFFDPEEGRRALILRAL